MALTDDKRLSPLTDKSFCFDCNPELECFTACCAKLTLELTPFDIVKLSRRLGLSTGEFLDKHTTAVEKPGKFTRVALLMNDDDQRCPFVTEKGCSVYEDRPGACRTYPLARATSPSLSGGKARQAFYLIREDHCKGFEKDRTWTVDTWLDDQGMDEYNDLNDLWMEILTRQKTILEGPGSEQKEKMFNLASYDLDQFREFVLHGGLLDRLAIPDRLVEKMKTDDVQLLRFACSWLRLSLLGEMTSALTRP